MICVYLKLPKKVLDIAPLTILNSGALQLRKWQLTAWQWLQYHGARSARTLNGYRISMLCTSVSSTRARQAPTPYPEMTTTSLKVLVWSWWPILWRRRTLNPTYFNGRQCCVRKAYSKIVYMNLVSCAYVVISGKEVMFSPVPSCLSVCQPVNRITQQTNEQNFIWNFL